MSELRELARFAREFRLESAPQKVADAARLCVLDSVGAALGAAEYDEIPAVCRELRKWTESKSAYQASVWAQGFRLDVFQALLLNGIMGHALELDDVHTGSKSHVGAVVVETAWTLAEAAGKTGKNFLESVVVGYEIMSRVGMAMDVVSNRKRGWHGTGIIGTFGAAAAAGRLLELTEDEMVWALGMAGTQSSGLWAFLKEGSTCKKLHPARAAVNGLTAAILAKGGMTGPEHILDAEDGGLYRAISDSFDLSRLTRGLGEDFEILHIDKKPYPCCRTTHHAIDGALALKRKLEQEIMDGQPLDPGQIEKVVVETYEVGVLQCGFTGYPRNPVEAKFSIPYTTAAALMRGRVSLTEFTREALEEERIKMTAGKVCVVSDAMFSERYPARWGSRVRITLTNSIEYIKQIDDMSGSSACPLTRQQEKEKFEGLVEPILGKEETKRLEEEILSIDQMEEIPKIRTTSM